MVWWFYAIIQLIARIHKSAPHQTHLSCYYLTVVYLARKLREHTRTVPPHGWDTSASLRSPLQSLLVVRFKSQINNSIHRSSIIPFSTSFLVFPTWTLSTLSFTASPWMARQACEITLALLACVWSTPTTQPQAPCLPNSFRLELHDTGIIRDTIDISLENLTYRSRDCTQLGKCILRLRDH